MNHGTEGCYQYHRCRCPDCVQAHADYARDQRAGLHRRELAPHGTAAAARRHRRRGTPLCEPCRQAERAARGAENPSSKSEDLRDKRNNLPVTPYRWRGQTYPWAVRRLAQAEAIHGRPDDEAAA